MKKSNPVISIIIVHYHVQEALFACLSSLKETVRGISYEVLVIDNDEIPSIEKELRKIFPGIRYIKSKENVGFGAANNIGAASASGEFLLFLNPDTIVKDDTVKRLHTFLKEHKRAGIAAPLLYHPDGKIFEKQGVRILTPVRALFSTSLLHRIFPNNSIANSYWMKGWSKKKIREVDVVPGTAFMLKREVFKIVGGFDERFFLYFEEFDFCRRIKKFGYSLFMLPQTKVIHLWGVSTDKRENIESIFTESQTLYFRKYYGSFVSKILSLFLTFNKYLLVLLLILLIGLFLRTYKITELFMFIGDFGWFYLSAYDMLTKGIIPLVSIPSSVVWLHQGPLATYLITFALFVGNMNPIAPAILFSLLDVATISLLFVIGRKLYNSPIGISAAFLYATSPLVLINVRMPYHTSPIPFFTCFAFLIAISVLEKRKGYFWLFFLAGILLQLELSNAIILFIFFILYFIYRREYQNTLPILVKSISGLLVGISPFILYDLTHNFTQTLGFPLWIINRIRLFLGLTTTGNATNSSFPNAVISIWEHTVQIVFPYSQLVVALLLILSLYVVLKKLIQNKFHINSQKPFVILSLWIIVPIISFMIHAAPGDAYYPFLYPAIILLVAYTLAEITKNNILLLFLISLSIGIWNASYTVSQEYFLFTQNGRHLMPPNAYGFGPAFIIHDEVANFIVKHANGKPVSISMGGYQGTVKTGGDQFRFLLLEKGVKLSSNAKQSYVLYETVEKIPPADIEVFRNKYFSVTVKKNN